VFLVIRRVALSVLVAMLLSLVPLAGAAGEDGYYTWTSGDVPLTLISSGH
jgi:hypothetical protein